MQSLRAGTIVDGKFEILATLGSGGMGSVYKARQISLDRIVALKVLHSFALSDQEGVKRFEREAKALSVLTSKQITQFLDFGFWENRIPYLSMEYVESETLRQVLNRQDRLSWKQALSIASQLADALSYCHASGIIHRDLKPENVFVVLSATKCTVKLADFGLAKLTVSGNGNTLTKTGLLIGSPHYMSPEQGQGMLADERSDIYSLGCVLFEMLSGSRPFEADTALGVMFRKNNETAPALDSSLDCSGLPKEISLVLSKNLEENPALRSQTAKNLKDEIDEILAEHNDLPDKVAVKSLAPIALRVQKKDRNTIFISALVVCILVPILFFLGRGSFRDSAKSSVVDALVLRKKGVSQIKHSQILSYKQVIATSIELAKKGETQQAKILLEEWLKTKRLRKSFVASEEATATRTLANLQENSEAIASIDQALTAMRTKHLNATVEICELLACKLSHCKGKESGESSAKELALLMAQDPIKDKEKNESIYSSLALYQMSVGKYDDAFKYMNLIKLPANCSYSKRFGTCLQKSIALFLLGKRADAEKEISRFQQEVSTLEQDHPDFRGAYKRLFPASTKFVPTVYDQNPKTSNSNIVESPEASGLTDTCHIAFSHNRQKEAEFATMFLKFVKQKSIRAELLLIRSNALLAAPKSNLESFLQNVRQAGKDAELSASLFKTLNNFENEFLNSMALYCVCQIAQGNYSKASDSLQQVTDESRLSEAKIILACRIRTWVGFLWNSPCPRQDALNCYDTVEKLFNAISNEEYDENRRHVRFEYDTVCVQTLQKTYAQDPDRTLEQVDKFSQRQNRSKCFSTVLLTYRGYATLRNSVKADRSNTLPSSRAAIAAALSYFLQGIGTYKSDNFEKGSLKYYLRSAYVGAAYCYLLQGNKPAADKQLASAVVVDEGENPSKVKVDALVPLLGLFSLTAYDVPKNEIVFLQCLDYAESIMKDLPSHETLKEHTDCDVLRLSILHRLRVKNDFDAVLQKISQLQKRRNSDLVTSGLEYYRTDALIKKWAKRDRKVEDELAWQNDLDQGLNAFGRLEKVCTGVPGTEHLLRESRALASIWYLFKHQAVKSSEMLDRALSCKKGEDADEAKLWVASIVRKYGDLFLSKDFNNSFLLYKEYATLCNSLPSPRFNKEKKLCSEQYAKLLKDSRKKH